MILVNQLYIYPVKSMAGIALNQQLALKNGFVHDRIFMLSEPDGTFLTARAYPQLLQITTFLNESGIMLLLPNQQTIQVNFSDFSPTKEPTEVWGNHFTSHIASISVNRFLSEFLQRDVQLRWLGVELTRRIKRYPEVSLSFADGYPYLLLNLASFNYLQQQCPEPLDIRQFRGNIIIDHVLPFAEDSWKIIKIGDIIFDLVKPCSRCVMTTINSKTNQYLPQNEPLKTLRYFRQDTQGDIDFGVNMIARSSGVISVGDTIEVLEKQMAKNYIKTFPRETLIAEKTCTIQVDNDIIIEGNNKQSILEQLEQHQVFIANSCRSGVCGRCQITLEDGEVAPMIQSAIGRNKRILACSCIPKGNIKVSIKPTRSKQT